MSFGTRFGTARTGRGETGKGTAQLGRPQPASASTRRRIEALAGSLTLPTVRRALGVVEGEHTSHRRFGSDDVMDIRSYTIEDEARLIDWKTSARAGQPMVVQRERLVTSRAWLLLDVGREMCGACPSGETAYQVAANALCMFAGLSLKRSDDVSLVFADAASITRVPFHGGFAQFERTLDAALERDWRQPRNIDALLSYARRIRDREALIVLATDEHALRERHLRTIRSIARTHPVVLIDVATLNPLDAEASDRVIDGVSRRRVPAFLRDVQGAQEVTTHRDFLAAALEHELAVCGSTLIRAGSSEAMFARFVSMISFALTRSAGSYLAAGARRPLQVQGVRKQ
ncbi:MULTISPECIES: DUF58 domain-containing protein [Bifidobacterium]|uniref:DUF58 domain-containing protein n=1 Tax=Bifidobacterium tibiigranuli TaxID=2172043 RepID=A0A5N6RYR6_9BIFI|nr:DUF58 domain-containing protein [Bifidobacterium tibiigranuli]KAE8127189.1 DUF58 domain-containing protein [Bifidobacterium tibiigranuli]KAE8127588.1 DUF58 domain-containing protein [Bifidobacterium tibiigranuli]MCI1211316.1 DUF58 domain-containing protein [Bifidobacterium tibiigranuli]MCI1220714.1 DUF58 domain-containing protein [Bifidobacterium tibiigranuli]MCI1232192.1 DUF58 domain-containing protein [Bifidobacterium tibiigranuli]